MVEANQTVILAGERKDDKKSYMPQVICLALTICVMGLSYMLFNNEIPPGNSQIALVVLGAVMTKWSDAVGYWLNSSSSSAETKKLLARKQ